MSGDDFFQYALGIAMLLIALCFVAATVALLLGGLG